MAHGFTVLRLTNEEVLLTPERAIARIVAAL
jgi:very-short-patch-repair endonuclease